MAKRRFRPEDAYRLKTAADPDLSPDARRVAYVVVEADEDADRLRSSIWVAAAGWLDAGAQVQRRPCGQGAALVPRRPVAGLHLGSGGQARAGAPAACPARRRRAGPPGQPAGTGERTGVGARIASAGRGLPRGTKGPRAGERAGAQRPAPRARAGGEVRRNRLAGRTASPVRGRCREWIPHPGDPRRLRPRPTLVLAGRHDDCVRVRSPPAPGRPPAPSRRVGRARDRW